MAQTPYAGLFTGPSQGDIRQGMRLERKQRGDKAFRDTLASGNLDAANAARYRQNQMDSLGEIGDAFAGAIDQGLGLEGRLVQRGQDPRLTKAIKRDRDKSEIMSLLSGFAEEGSDGGKNISEKELKLGFAELMKRGYDKEAAEWLKRAQSMEEMDIKKDTLKTRQDELAYKKKKQEFVAKSPKYHVAFGARYVEKGRYKQAVIRTPKEGVGGEPEKKIVDFGPVTGPDAISPTDRKGMSSPGRVGEASDIAEGQQKAKRGTVEFTEKMRRTTAELQSKLNIDANTAKKFSDHVLSTRTENMKAGNAARRGVSKVRAMLAYTKVMESGGNASAAFKALKRVFGYEGKDSAAFRTRARMQLIRDLRKLMGARPTDVDLQKMEGAYPTEDQPIEANKAILEDMLERYEQEIDTGDWWADNKDGTPRQFSKYLKKKYEVKVPEEGAGGGYKAKDGKTYKITVDK